MKIDFKFCLKLKKVEVFKIIFNIDIIMVGGAQKNAALEKMEGGSESLEGFMFPAQQGALVEEQRDSSSSRRQTSRPPGT